MGRLANALILGLAVAIAVLGGREAGPVAYSLLAPDGALCSLLLQRPAFGGASRVRILLIGADKRPGDKGRSDTLLVLSLNPRTHRLALLGIPRDLLVGVPGHGHTKINHAYAYGGTALTRRTVGNLLGVKLDYEALVFFDGFVHAVDALGGVTVDVPDVEGKGRGMNYDDNAGNLHIHLKPGTQHLNGRQALGFVRYRKSNTPGLGDSDEARSGRQQQFLKALAEQHLRAASLPGLLAAAKMVQQNLQTDMPSGAMTDFVRTLHGCSAGRMVTATVPLLSSNWHGQGTYYARPDMAALHTLWTKSDAFLDAGPSVAKAPSPTHPQTPASVEALNACGVGGRARQAAERLTPKGFKLVRITNANQSNLAKTVIQYRPDRESDAKRIRSILGCGELRQTKAASGAADIRIYVGRDYKP